MYVIRDGVIQVIESLQEASEEVFCRFANNHMKANPDKFHLTTSSVEGSIRVENYNRKSSKCEKLLDVKINNKLNFNKNIDEVKKQDRNKYK